MQTASRSGRDRGYSCRRACRRELPRAPSAAGLGDSYGKLHCGVLAKKCVWEGNHSSNLEWVWGVGKLEDAGRSQPLKLKETPTLQRLSASATLAPPPMLPMRPALAAQPLFFAAKFAH